TTMTVDVTVLSATGSLGLYDYVENFNLVTDASSTTTKVRSLDAAHGIWIELAGTGFTYDGSGHLTGGTITEIDFRNSSNTLLETATGFNMDAASFAGAVSSFRSTAPNENFGSAEATLS